VFYPGREEKKLKGENLGWITDCLQNAQKGPLKSTEVKGTDKAPQNKGHLRGASSQDSVSEEKSKNTRFRFERRHGHARPKEVKRGGSGSDLGGNESARQKN